MSHSFESSESWWPNRDVEDGPYRVDNKNHPSLAAHKRALDEADQKRTDPIDDLGTRAA